MISAKMQKALNDQINFEFYSSYLYLSMSAFFNRQSLSGFGNWMRVQTQEEGVHAIKLYDFLSERDGKVVLQTIKQPPNDWKSPLEVFQQSYAHEQKVTSNFHEITDLALKEKDHTTATYVQWFINEQIEEEANAKKIVDQLKMIKSDVNALLLLDRELGARVFTMPAGATIGAAAAAP